MALRIIKEIGIQNFIIFSNSQLVVNWCQSYFKVRDPSLIKYEKKVQSLMTKIKNRQSHCELRQVARRDNEEAN